MQAKVQGASGQQKLPNTQLASLLNDQLLIMIRSWNGAEINQKIIDEISHYMSAVEADLEVTSPFGYSEYLTVYANKLKIALMLANHAIYNTDNRQFYQQGAEVVAVFKKNNEIAWASIGRYSIESQKHGRKIKLFDSGVLFDDEILLPTNLLGLYKDPEIFAGSVSTKNLELIEIKSIFAQYESVWECSISGF